MAGMTADAVYVLLGNEIVLLTEKIEQMGGWEPLEHKGTVQTAEDLPTDAKKGWMYNIATDSIYGAAGMNVVMTSEGWDSMGPIINMALYLTKEEAGKSYQPKGNYLSGTDSTLTEPGKAADAKETGDKFSKTSADLEGKLDKNQGSENSGKIAGINESGDIVPMFPVGVEYNEETNCLEFGSDQGMKLNQGIGLDSTLTKTGFAADAGVTGKEINSLKESISTKITKFYASSQGETHLADSDNGKIMDMMLYGKSEQKQYSGKNLLKSTYPTTIYNGVTCTNNSDGTFTLNGTATANCTFIILRDDDLKKIFESHENVKLSGAPKGSSRTGYYLQMWKNEPEVIYYDIGNGVTLEKPNAGCNIAIMVTKDTVCNNLLFKPMIVDTEKYPDATYDDFEPYVGGTPSPNPSYPQEILSVKNPTVKVCGKNLLNYDAWSQIDCANGKAVYENNGVTITALRNDAFTNYDMSKFPATARIPVNVGETITISWDEPLNKEGRVYVFGNASTSNMTYVNNSSSKQLKYTIPSGVTFITFRFGVTNAGDTISYKNVQIEKSSTPTAYEPYHEQTVTLPYDLYDVKVPSGGNITIDGQQYVSDYADVERGKLVRMVGDINFNNIRYNSQNNIAYFMPSDLGYELSNDVFTGSYVYNNQSAMFNALSHTNVTLSEMKDGTWKISDMLYIKNSSLGSKAEYLSWFNEIGLIGMIMLAKPEEIDLTPEEVQALKALATYYPTTNISVNSEQLDGYTVFNYPISMQNGWNYVKQQIGDTRDYIYDMDARTQDTDLQAAEAYVNSEYAVALTELEV